jgi:hypothetical protein
MKTFSELVEELTAGRDLNLVEIASVAYEEQSPVDLDEDEIEEDAPANSAGGGAIAGIGVGPNGEPGVPMRKKQAVVVGPKPTDPRMFQAQIFNRKPPTM